MFTKLKNKMAGEFLSVETFKNRWGGVAVTLTKDDYTGCYAKWVERH